MPPIKPSAKTTAATEAVPQAPAPPPRWSLPPPLVALLALDDEARATTVDKILRRTHPNAVPYTPTTASSTKKTAPSHPFTDALRRAPDTRTWNGAAAFSTTGSALLDLFDGLQAGVRAEQVFAMLGKAWEEDAEKTLRIIFHTRSIHEGKGLEIGFFNCAAWLWDNHPRTLLANLRLLVEPTCERARSKAKDAAKAEKDSNVVVLDEDGEPEREPEYPPRPHGSFKDLNDILVLAIHGQLTTAYTKKLTALDEALAPAHVRNEFKNFRVKGTENMGGGRAGRGHAAVARQDLIEERMARKAARKAEEEGAGGAEVNDTAGPKKRKPEDVGTFSLRSKLARCGSKEMREAAIAEHTHRGLADPKVQILMAEVVSIYTESINADLKRLKAHNTYLERPHADRQADGYGAPKSSPHLFGMSYAAKWAPSPGKSADKQLHIATALAMKFFPEDDDKKARRRFQDEVLAPLRRVLDVPETRMVKGNWKMNYSKVPARCMTRNQINFCGHDPRGFDKYLLAVTKGKKSIAAASLVPHEILREALSDQSIISRVANLQWTSLVDSIRSSAKGELSNCIAVADTSASMGTFRANSRPYDPIWPCLALSLLLAELSRPPWNGAFITFSTEPKIQRVDNSLPIGERAREMSTAHWNVTTNYLEVFRNLLEMAKANGLAPKDMVKTVFVFSDMQFNASGRFGETEHQAVTRNFEDAGYPVPNIVYWDLAAATAKPVQADTPGTALWSGSSGALMKYFLRTLGKVGEEEEEEEEDAKDAEDAEEWDDLMGESADESAAEPKEQATKEKATKEKSTEGNARKNPVDHLNEMIGAKPFDGVVLVD